MKKFFIILIALHASLLTPHEANAQWGCTCLPEGITFNTQAQIDSFPVNYPGCIEIGGDVAIHGAGITNLLGLNAITSVSGNLRIIWTHITSLEGLNNLINIGGDLRLGGEFQGWPSSGNHNLTNLAALQNLDSIGGSLCIADNISLNSLNGLENISAVENLTISGNDNLSDLTGIEGITVVNGNLKLAEESITTLEGLNNLTSVGDSLFIGIMGDSWVGTGYRGNPLLVNLDGLQNLTFLGGSLLIYSNDNLIDLSGIDNLNFIGGHVIIGAGSSDAGSGANPSLVNLTGLNSLDSIPGDLIIQFNHSLLNLNGLNGLISIGGNLEIRNDIALASLTGLEGLTSIGGSLTFSGEGYSIGNPSLTSLMGLENLNSIGGGLNISYNSSLSTCDAQWLCDYLAAPNGVVNIFGNANGCNSIIEVAYSCGSVSCLPYGNYGFYSQSDIDLFQAAFPNCTTLQGDVTISGNDITNLSGLDAVTFIRGDLLIVSNAALTSLSGLDQLNSIGGDFRILSNDALTSLGGLENLTFIGGNLEIFHTLHLTSLNGLVSLTSIGGSLQIGCFYPYYLELDSLNGLDNLTFIGDNLEISNTQYLTNLNGLDNLTSIGGNLSISRNYALTNLTGLENLAFIGGSFTIGGEEWSGTGNPSLTSLMGLENLNSIGSGLNIRYNSSLSTCDAEWLCDYLAAPNGGVNIYGNANGCNSIIEVAYSCGGVFCLPYGNYRFHSQSDIDLFKTAFPNCTTLHGDVLIGGDDITDLSGLDAVTSIGGYLSISGNDALTSLSGLENLDSTGGYLYIKRNDALTSLNGLESLTSIGGGLSIGGTSMGGAEEGNHSLTSLTGLENLASIRGYLLIGNNDAQTSLTGLENIDAGSIEDLYIYNNDLLSTCEVQSICDYLASPGGVISIQNNAPGCDSPEEVEEACLGVGVAESAIGGQRSAVRVFPNPVSDKLTLDCSGMEEGIELVELYNLFGARVAAYRAGDRESIITLDMSGLPSGVYCYRLTTSDQRPTTVTGKVIKL